MTTTPRSRTRRLDTLAALAIGLVGALVYLPALTTGFVADDYFILSRLQDMDGLRHPAAYFQTAFFGYYRPVAFLSHAIDWHFWALDPRGYHLTSIVLHGATSAAVFVLARRVMTLQGALVASALFATHAASHETIYWMAARFDLLATLLTLIAVILLGGNRPGTRAVGLAAFAAALLSKESALALPALTASYDVLVRRLDWRSVVWRLIPVAVVLVSYAAIRAIVPDLAGGDVQRLPKLAVLAAALVAILWYAKTGGTGLRLPARAVIWIGIAGVVLISAAAVWPPTSAWTMQKLGFLSYAAFFLVSPVVLPPPSQAFFSPASFAFASPGFVVLVVGATALWMGRAWLDAHRPAAFGIAFTFVSLVPVLSLTGSPRYVYMATAGASLLGGYVVTRLSGARRVAVAAVMASVVLVSVWQLFEAGRAWREASAAIDDGLDVMANGLEPCGTKDIVLVTAPVGIGGIYSNFYWDMFKVRGCAPASLSAVLRVMRTDADIAIRRNDGTIEISVANYEGNLVASRDLRHFDLPIAPGSRLTLVTPAGELATYPAGAAQVFRLTTNDWARQSRLYYYGNGRVRALK